MCGEHRSIVGIGVACQGSSPHVRGARLGSTLNAAAMGIIPACAGSTLSLSTTQALRWDHPRMCGEHYFGDTLDSAVWGSSPHVRGARFSSVVLWDLAGIIPACAGSTTCVSWREYWPRDHPRMCGEHFHAVEQDGAERGSSPHVRGAHNLTVDSVQNIGIIPACAGSTFHWFAVRSALRDHPRMCGEHTSKIA